MKTLAFGHKKTLKNNPGASNHHKKQVFEVIKSSHVTEKVSDLTSASNQYAFKVKKDSSKREIKKAVEETFQNAIHVVGK